MISFENRRTIRKYTDEVVTDELIAELLRVASRAATMGNLQLYSVVKTRDAEMKHRLSAAHYNQPMVHDCSVVLTFCADYNRTTAWCNNRKATPGYDNLLSFVNAASDTLLLTQAFCTLAEERGLGTCYLGTTVYNAKQLIDLFHLPKLVFPIASITVGYPDENPAQTDRLPVDAFLHSETYQENTSERIDEFYSLKEALPENKHFVDINHKETLAQVFADIRYKKADNEAISATLLQTLHEQGFM